jgi:2-amino-4-hydroxy-6-hydroxymethyldihydropteridine diphosphokinase
VRDLIQSSSLLLALGGNIPGPWGNPYATLERAVCEIEGAGVGIVRRSRFYLTRPLGAGHQPTYLNAVVIARANMPPAGLLRLLKRIEQRAGRRLAPPMRPRPLDIDILDYGGRRIGWPPRRRERARIILPHPQLHARAFVLIPVQEIAPQWRHPATGVTVKTLLMQLSPSARAGVRPSP